MDGNTPSHTFIPEYMCSSGSVMSKKRVVKSILIANDSSDDEKSG